MSLTKSHLPKCQRQNVRVEKSARFFFDIYIEKSGVDFDGFYLAILKKNLGNAAFFLIIFRDLFRSNIASNTQKTIHCILAFCLR